MARRVSSLAAPSPRSILSASRAYAGLSPEAGERLASIGRLVTLAESERVFRAGDPCPGVYVMHSGVVRLSNTAPTGKIHVLHFAEAGESFAEAAVIGRFPCPVDADVLEKGIALKIPSEALWDLLANDHALCLGFLQVMSLRNQRVVDRARDIALRDAAGRLAHFLLERSPEGYQEGPVVQLMVSKRELAKHLNLTSETLSRVLRRLVDAGTIECDDHHEVRITNAAHLRTLAWGEPPP